MASRKDSTFTAYFTVTLAFLVALIFPLGYFVISHQHAIGSLEAEAEINAQIVAGLLNASHEQWKFEPGQLEALLSRRPRTGQPESLRILDSKGAEIAAVGGNLQAPIIRRTQPLRDARRIAGSIEISRSLLPILEQTAMVALFGFGIGLLVFILLPFRAISRAQGQLRDSYSFLTRVMESSTNAIIVINLGGTIEMVNGRCDAMSGYPREELCGAPIERLFDGCAAAQVLQELEQVASGTAEMVKFETDLLRRDGTSVTICCGAAPIFQEGHISGTVLSVEDIMERKLAAEQLKRAKEYTENLIQAASVIIVGLDPTGVVTLLNRTAEEVTGYSAAELTGENWFQRVTSAEAFVEVCGPRDPAEKTGTHEIFENQIITKNGAMRTISWRNSPIMEDGRSVGTLCFGIDITEHRMIEAQLRQSQKMESIGQLAGGVAHDFNNMLSVILGYAQLCQLEVTQGGMLWQYIYEITKAGERSRDMVRQLLAFSRKEIISPRAVNLNAHCIETERTLSRLIGEEITLSFLPSTQLWTVKIDPSQADQILINLAVNARDAMPGGGRLAVETSNVSIDEEFCHYHLDARPGDYACLAVRDTGTGMEHELVKRIFEPFFTTKEVGKGTGLGLATVYGIVTQNNGFIEVESEPGRGTSFMIYLPRLPEETETAFPEQPEPLTGTGTVLVVEDDAMMRSMARQLLEKIGYRVIEAETPERALSICRDKIIPLDLVLSDVVMPGMNGREMAQGIAGLRPGLKLLFMSGYPSDIVAKRGIMEPGTNYIQKPFDMEELNRKIQETLQSVQTVQDIQQGAGTQV
jgi:two-component system, cell cycle sensor histidine kinase and response regulator CckA